jgi:hypothetical protein
MNADASKILVRLPAALHAELKRRAEVTGRTLNQVCVDALSQPAAQATPWQPILDSRLGSHLDGIVLFGSRARGDARASSDTDLLLVLSAGVALTRDLYVAWDKLAAVHPGVLPRQVSPHFSCWPQTPAAAGSLWLEVALDGVVLWERDFAVSRFLASVRRYLLAGGASRKTTYGVPYWVREHAESAVG